MTLKGTTWPWNIFPEFVEGDSVINNNLNVAMFTPVGSRKMNNSFGNQLQAVVFENKGPILEALARREIGLMVSNSLPLISIDEIKFFYDEDDNDSPVEIVVNYVFEGEKFSSSVTVNETL
jgi:phage baseplate assembly protein W